MITSLATVEQELGPELAQMPDALAWVRGYQVTDDLSLEHASDLLRRAKARWAELEERRTSLTKPLLGVKKGIDDLFKPLLTMLSEAEQVLKGKIGDYDLARENERRALMQTSAAEHAAGGIPTAIIPEPVQAQGLTIRQVWDFEFTDESQVPRDLCSPDVKKIKALVPRHGTPAEIPGVRWFQRWAARARAAK